MGILPGRICTNYVEASKLSYANWIAQCDTVSWNNDGWIVYEYGHIVLSN